jgi:hypothetical protein
MPKTHNPYKLGKYLLKLKLMKANNKSYHKYIATLTPPLEKLVIHLKKLSDNSPPQSSSKWKIVNKVSLSPSETENSSKDSNLIKKTPLYNLRKRKRVSEKNPEDAKGESIKKTCYSVAEEGVPWKTERKQLLNRFKEIKINDKLEAILAPFPKKSLNERKAIIHNNYAVFIIESLMNPEVSDLNKLDRLDKAKKIFMRSAEFYTQAGLIKKKGGIIACIDSITLSIEKLRTLSNNTSMTTLSATQKEPIRSSHLKVPYPYYLTRTFAKNLSSENKTTTDDRSQINDHKPR